MLIWELFHPLILVLWPKTSKIILLKNKMETLRLNRFSTLLAADKNYNNRFNSFVNRCFGLF